MCWGTGEKQRPCAMLASLHISSEKGQVMIISIGAFPQFMLLLALVTGRNILLVLPFVGHFMFSTLLHVLFLLVAEIQGKSMWINPDWHISSRMLWFFIGSGLLNGCNTHAFPILLYLLPKGSLELLHSFLKQEPMSHFHIRKLRAQNSTWIISALWIPNAWHLQMANANRRRTETHI